MSRWPFNFSLDDVDIRDDPDHPQGVMLVHYPSDSRITMNVLATRDANTQAAFRRLHSHLQRNQQPQS